MVIGLCEAVDVNVMTEVTKSITNFSLNNGLVMTLIEGIIKWEVRETGNFQTFSFCRFGCT